ncbi:LYR motif-containing protein 1 isoform X4 [Alligator sinensis]|uniref:LYR motif-containing protein 1 isoform X4 n=1 Tax=Alligator sinensis TaxID=38654 RepID=A0A1U7S8E6_ALLSI|nr:LYR motif-containing protein 1 isoform X4 [Alligator sinensis]
MFRLNQSEIHVAFSCDPVRNKTPPLPCDTFAVRAFFQPLASKQRNTSTLMMTQFSLVLNWDLTGTKMTPVTRREVLGLYRKIFRIAKKWQSVSGQMEDTIKEKQYIINEAKTLFQKNKNIHLPPMGLAQKHGRTFQKQEKLRKLSKPVYLKSYDEIS